MIIICHYCLLKIGTSRFVCPLMPLLKEINYCYEYYSKRFLDSEVFPPSSSSTFLIPHFLLLTHFPQFVHHWRGLWFCFVCFAVWLLGQLCWIWILFQGIY